MNLEQLTAAVFAARVLGKLAARRTKDDGSCSLDMVHIPVGREYVIKRRSAAVLEALERTGSVVDRESGFWRGYLLAPGIGTASARLEACRAMAEALKPYGATVYYRVD